MAGGGIKRGFTYGATDDIGYHMVEGRMHIHDLQATILHCLDLDPTKPTCRFPFVALPSFARRRFPLICAHEFDDDVQSA